MDNKTVSPAMSTPLVTTLDNATSGAMDNNKFTTSGRDTTYNVQKNFNVNIGVFHDVIGFLQVATKLFVALIGMNWPGSTGAEEQDEVDVSGIVPPDPSSLPVSNIADKYTRSMLECMAGYPLYEPHPFCQHSKEYSHNGINVGDVGFVADDGAFDFLFNICPPQNCSVNPPNLPNGFSLDKPEDAETKPIRPLERGTCIFPSTVKKAESGEYICKASEGAILELPEGAIESGAINNGRFEELAKRYGVEWYEYTKTRGRSISNGSLYLVTSFTKCTQWGIAVFDRPGDPGQALTFVSSPPKWKGLGPLFTRVSGPNQGDTQNQCVFLRGYKLMIRQDIFDKLPTRQRATRIRGGGGTDFISRLLFRTRTKTPTVTRTDAVALHANFNSSPVHPSDLINAELLNQNPDAKVALTHDDVWCDLLRDNFPELNLATLINISRSYTKMIDEYGCVSLAKILESNNNSHPVRLGGVGGTEITALQESIQDTRVERNPNVSIPAQTSTALRPQSVHHSPGEGDEAPHPLRDGDVHSRETRENKHDVSISPAPVDYPTKLPSIDRGDRVVQKTETPSISFIPSASNCSEIHVNSAIDRSSHWQGPDIQPNILLSESDSSNGSLADAVQGIPNTSQNPFLSPEPSILNFQLLHSSSNAPAGAVQSILDTSQSGEGKVIILLFDDAGKQFGADSTIFRFFKALKRSDDKKQIVYYQPGIDAYNKYSFITHSANPIISTVNAVFPLHLDKHVKEGYGFIVQKHQPGDRICIFGFSRGAYTARAVADMVYKVGVLPKENINLVDFAFSIYSTNGYKLSQEFKQTLVPASAHQIYIDFLGVWDTVSSVGIIPPKHPDPFLDYVVKKFRHALSLDEHRARFRPEVWSEITLSREHELAVDMPVPDIGSDAHASRDDFEYVPPERDTIDVKEVWFAGTHTDVGGGSHLSTRSASLSFIPLRWMIKECILSETDIIFDLKYLRDDLNFDFDDLLKGIGESEKQNGIKQYKELAACRDAQLEEMDVTKDTMKDYTEDDPRLIQRLNPSARDSLNVIFDLLVIFWYFWWLFEIIPMLYTYQDDHGNWVRRRMCNFGRGRYIPVYKNKVLVHSSVEERIRATGGERQDETNARPSGFFNILLDRFKNREQYRPRAYNWDYLEQQNVIKYVD